MIAIMSTLIADEFASAPLRRLHAGEALFFAGDPVTHIALVREGGINLVRQSRSGGEVILQRAVPGQVLAEASIYSPSYHCDARATRESGVSLLPVTAFRSRLREDPALHETWAAHLARSVQKARMIAEMRTLRTVAERLDAWLDEGSTLPQKGLRHELARELGVSPEALYRELARRRALEPQLLKA
jgi:CRP/FNR family transcriptional regulator, dissimilatory nitrate respiration regulator